MNKKIKEAVNEEKQISFAWKSGLLFWGIIALFISLCIIGAGGLI